MNKYTVHTRSYNDRSDPESLFGHNYGCKSFSPGSSARDASDAISKATRTWPGAVGLAGVSGITLDQCQEVRAAEHQSFEALKVALKEQGRL